MKQIIIFDKDTDCWIWNGFKLPTGYGVLYANGHSIYAHRHFYEKTGQIIPYGLVLDHLCRNPSCVNPDHLEPVPTRENVLRGIGPAAINAQKMVCINGHAFEVDSRGKRRCKTCIFQKIHNPAYKRKKALYDKRRYERLKGLAA